MSKSLSSPLGDARWYDITIPLHNGVAHWPGDTPFEFRQAATMESGSSVDVGTVTMSVHSGTHVDAPAHFRPGAPSTSELDLTVLVGAVHVVGAQGHDELGPEVFGSLDFSQTPRVLVRTGSWVDYNAFPETIPTLSGAAVAFLGERGVVLLGVDVPSVDVLDSKELPIHHALAEGGFTVLEGLDLRAVPPGRYHLTALPLRILGADGAPVRAFLVADPDPA